MTATILAFQRHNPILPPTNPELRYLVAVIPQLVEAFGAARAAEHLRIALGVLRLRGIEAKWNPDYAGTVTADEFAEAAAWLSYRIGELEA